MSQKIQFKEGMRIGRTELQLLQELGIDNMAALASALSTSLPAVIPTTGGDLTTELQVTAGSTTVSIAPGSAVMKNGTVLILSTASSLAVSTNVTNVPVVLRADTTPYGPGTLNLASDRVTLTYVPDSGSSETAGSYYSANDAVRLQDGATDKGTFRVLSVSGNTIVLADSVSGTGTITGLKHAPAGKFFPGYPSGSSDMLLFDSAGLRIESAGYTVGTNEIILATVTRGASGAPVVTDARVPYRPRGLNNIVNSMVSATASIDESKLDLSDELTRAKQVAPYLRYEAGKLLTTQSDLYVTRNGELRRVLVAEDIVLPAFTNFSVNPSQVSMPLGGSTQTLTATVTAQSGVTPTYTFTSSNPAVLTVTSTGNTATVTAVAAGSASVICRAEWTAPSGSAYMSTSDTRTVAIAVTSSTTASVLTSITSQISNTVGGTLLDASTTQINYTQASDLSTSVTTAAGAGTTSFSYSWELLDGAGTYVSLSATNTQKVTVTARSATGSARIRATVTSVSNTGGLVNNSLSTVFTVNVVASGGTGTGGTPNITMLPEPGFRVVFRRTSSGDASIGALVRFGISGTATVSGSVATLTLDTEDEQPPYSSSALIGQAFYDTSGRKYVVTANTASTASPVTVTLAKTVPTDPDATSGTFTIRSHATSYRVEILSSSNVTINAQDFGQGSTGGWFSSNGGALLGQTYNFRLTARNPGLTPSSASQTLTKTWALTSTGGTAGTVNIPSDWVTARPTGSGVIFEWDARAANGFNPTTMDYRFSYNVTGSSWTEVVVQDSAVQPNVAGQILRQFVSQSPGASVNARLRITDLSGSVNVNNPASGYDAYASGVVPSTTSGALAQVANYAFELTSGTVWTLNTANGRSFYTTELVQRIPNPMGSGFFTVPTSFTTTVTVERIDFTFTTPLAQATGTAVIKPIVYPSGDLTSLIAGNLVTEGGSQSSQNIAINAPVNAAANSFITVALEYATTGDPNSLDPTGIGVVSIWFKPTSG